MAATMDRISRAAYSKREVCEMINVSTKTLDRMIARGEIKAFKVGSQVRIHISELNRIMGMGDAA